VPLGCAPGCPAEYQAILNILPKPPPECTHPLSRLLFVSATKQAQYSLLCSLRISQVKRMDCVVHASVRQTFQIYLVPACQMMIDFFLWNDIFTLLIIQIGSMAEYNEGMKKLNENAIEM